MPEKDEASPDCFAAVLRGRLKSIGSDDLLTGFRCGESTLCTLAGSAAFALYMTASLVEALLLSEASLSLDEAVELADFTYE